MNKLYNEWINKAEEDFSAVEILIKQSQFPASVVCFHCQQTAEKYLKAILVANNIEFPRIHDLAVLIDQYCNNVSSDFQQIKDEAILLTDFSVSPRYPDYLFEPSVEDAKEAYDAALRIKKFILSRLK